MNDYFIRDGYKRIEEMFLLRQLGAPYHVIGKRYDICVERVRQILFKRERMVKAMTDRLEDKFFEQSNYFRCLSDLSNKSIDRP